MIDPTMRTQQTAIKKYDLSANQEKIIADKLAAIINPAVIIILVSGVQPKITNNGS